MKSATPHVDAVAKRLSSNFVLGLLLGIFSTILVTFNGLEVFKTPLDRSFLPRVYQVVSDTSSSESNCDPLQTDKPTLGSLSVSGPQDPGSWRKHDASYWSTAPRRDRPPPPKRNKTILLYGDWHNKPVLKLPFSLEHCRVPYCKITADTDRWNEADALWWNRHSGPNNPLRGKGPPGRRPEQIYIYATNEAGNFDCSDPSQQERYSNMYNWTMSYHASADIAWSYGYYVATPWELMKPAAFVDKEIESIWGEKDSGALVLATSSHCNVSSRREEYITHLKKYIPVDFYGACGDLGRMPCQTDDDCRRFSKKYKFVLAFENTLCRDYVTEKFWKNTMLVGAIPVVRNSVDNEIMKRLAPPGSYINTHDFEGPRELANYLELVGNSKSRFSSYFQWKKDYMLAFNAVPNNRGWASQELQTSGWCEVCEKLHSPLTEVQRASFDGFCDCIVPNDLEESK